MVTCVCRDTIAWYFALADIFISDLYALLSFPIVEEFKLVEAG